MRKFLIACIGVVLLPAIAHTAACIIAEMIYGDYIAARKH